MTKKDNKDRNAPNTSKEAKTGQDSELTTEASEPKAEKKTQTNKNNIKPQSQTDIEASPAHFEEKQGKRGVKLGTIAIILSLLFGGGLTLKMQQDQAEYQNQIAQLKAQISNTQSSTQQSIQSFQEATKQTTSNVVHKTQVLIEQQQKSIESLQLAMSEMKDRRPNDWLLAEADYLVKLAGRKLFLEHDVESATTLLESADQRIAALNDPSLVPLRQSMANDITKLRTIPLIDKDGLVLRLVALQQQVDNLPLANAILPEVQATEKAVVSDDISNWKDNLMTSLKDFSDNFITFRTRDGNVIPLLSPEQHFYLRENIKAKLETAIKSVYIEEGEVYQITLKTANQWATDFFNLEDNAVIEFNKALNQLQQQNIEVNYPTNLESQQQLADVIRDRLRREVMTMTSMEEQ